MHTIDQLPLSPDQLRQFHREGVLVLRQAYAAADIAAVQQGIHAIIGRVMQRHGIEDRRAPFAAERFDDGYNALIGLQRSHGAEVYDAVKQIPAFVRLLSHPLHEHLMHQLRPGSDPAIAAGGYGIRIDNPHEDRFRAQWHQEYPAQLRSSNGLVFWSTLVPMTPDMGPVVFCPGSHAEGLQPLVRSADPQRQGAYALMLRDEDQLLKRYPQVAPLTQPGDLVVIDFLVLHASGHNRAERSRWTMQFRYFDFAHASGMAHGWKGSFAAGVDFQKIHPELCPEA